MKELPFPTMNLNNYEQFSNYDVVHVTNFPLNDMGSSIIKIIYNLIKNIELKQCAVSTYDIGINMLIRILNNLNIKIVHFQCNPQMINIALRHSKLNTRSIQTVHHNCLSVLADHVNKVICIHDIVRQKNLSKGINNLQVIENTVDVIPRDKNKACPPLSFVSCSGICEYYFDYENVDCYSKINAPFHIYGFMNYPYSNEMENYILDKKNIFAHQHTENVIDDAISTHGCFTFFQPIKKRLPNWCYGLAVMEPARYGIPIVTIKRAKMNQKYIINGYNGFVVDTTEEFIDCCNLLTKDHGLYEQLYKNSYNNAIRLKNTMPEEYMKVYKELL